MNAAVGVGDLKRCGLGTRIHVSLVPRDTTQGPLPGYLRGNLGLRRCSSDVPAALKIRLAWPTQGYASHTHTLSLSLSLSTPWGVSFGPNRSWKWWGDIVNGTANHAYFDCGSVY